MVNKSPSIQKLAEALVVFNQKVSKIVKDAENPFFKKSKYATLSHILDVITEPMASSGLVLSQWPTGENSLTSLLIHAKSGEFIEATYDMTGNKNTPQERGSLISYQRRYAISSILNLNIADDDDGNAATFGEKAVKDNIKEKLENGGIKVVEEERNTMFAPFPPNVTGFISHEREDNKPWLNAGSEEYKGAVRKMKEGKSSLVALRKYFKISKKVADALVADAAAEF